MGVGVDPKSSILNIIDVDVDGADDAEVGVRRSDEHPSEVR